MTETDKAQLQAYQLAFELRGQAEKAHAIIQAARQLFRERPAKTKEEAEARSNALLALTACRFRSGEAYLVDGGLNAKVVRTVFALIDE